MQPEHSVKRVPALTCKVIHQTTEGEIIVETADIGLALSVADKIDCFHKVLFLKFYVDVHVSVYNPND